MRLILLRMMLESEGDRSIHLDPLCWVVARWMNAIPGWVAAAASVAVDRGRSLEAHPLSARHCHV
jgi:hypothetical protein